MRLGADLFRHLLRLPVAYFEARRVGDTVARVRELENIRSFLTSSALTLALDMLFTIVFLAVLLLYSPVLTLIVVISLPLYVLLAVLVTPVLRARLDERFNRSAEGRNTGQARIDLGKAPVLNFRSPNSPSIRANHLRMGCTTSNQRLRIAETHYGAARDDAARTAARAARSAQPCEVAKT